MKQSDDHIDTAWAEERVESYVDGTLSRAETKVFEKILKADEDLVCSVDLARQIRAGLASLPSPSCPPAAYESVLDIAQRHEAGSARKRSGWPGFAMLPRRKPAFAIVVASAVVAGAMTLLILNQDVAPQQNTEDVEAALRDVKLALSYVSFAGREAGSTIRLRAVDETMVVPVRRALVRDALGRIEMLGIETGAAEEDRAKRGES